MTGRVAESAMRIAREEEGEGRGGLRGLSQIGILDFRHVTLKLP